MAQASRRSGTNTSPQIVVTSPQGPVVRDARLEELLVAHQAVWTASALQSRAAQCDV
jgi:sigma-E factor negative regulatory protein RseA